MSQLENMQNTEENNSKASVGDKAWQFVRFAVITGIIFAGSFFIMNFHAYKTILLSVVDAEAQEEQSKLLENSAGEGEVDQNLLLPVLNEKKDENKSYSWLDFPVVPTDYRLVIPKIGKSVPIVETADDHLLGENWSELEKQIQNDLQKGVVHYPTTAQPGEIGNVFITGHSSYYPWDPGQYKDVFALLSQLEVGDVYYVYYNQKQFTYRVTEKKVVDPKDTSVLLQPKDQRISTLMTCYPVGTTKSRLIIRAEQVN